MIKIDGLTIKGLALIIWFCMETSRVSAIF